MPSDHSDFWRRLNRVSQERALVRAVLISRLQACLRASSTPIDESQYEPDICEPPSEFHSDEEWDCWAGRYQ